MPCSTLKKCPLNGHGREDRCFSASSTNLAISGGFKEIERTRRKDSFIKEMEMSADRTWHSIGLLSRAPIHFGMEVNRFENLPSM